MSIINQVPLLPSDPGVVDRGSQAFPNKGDKLEGVGGGDVHVAHIKIPSAVENRWVDRIDRRPGKITN